MKLTQTLHLAAPRHWLLSLCVAALLAACGGSDKSPPATSAENTASASAEDDVKQALALGVGSTNTSTTLRDAVRLADQATFGASEALITSLRGQGVEAWLAAQFVATGSSYTSGQGDLIHKPYVENFCGVDRGTPDCWRDWYSTEPLVWDFYRNAVTKPDQLRQRVAFALAQILVISNVEASATYGFRYFHNMLLNSAFGNYRELLKRTTLSPLMGEYLDHVNNDRNAPNENYARELLQLFALGTCKLNADGTLQSGRCLPTYNNQEVRDYAFALTGWTYPAGGSSIYGCWPEGANCTYFNGDMVASARLADNKARTLLNGAVVPASRTPAQALDTVLNSLMNHPNMAPFIGKQLIQHLVKSNPTPAYVQRVSSAFKTGRYQGLTRSFGSGSNGDLTATIAAVLLDTEARNSAPPLVAEKLREPVLLMTGLVRGLNGTTDGNAMGWWWGQNLRQHVFRSPSVFNFYPPNYPVINTKLVGPAFGIYNVNTALARLNFINQMVIYGGADPDETQPNSIGTNINMAAFEADAGDATKLVNRLADITTGGRMTNASRLAIVKAVEAYAPDPGYNWRAERAKTAAYLVFAAPAYQVLN
jgi:uncharacterized protein (DUF1800 family)